MNKIHDVDEIALEVEQAVLTGKYRIASEEEKMLVRIGALENIVRSYKELLVNSTRKNALLNT
ncbi:hypothetical protein AGMMS50230_10820 [Spirochaetia bacterium]|nr:hypothetical protein AGMMS50230_10820 [Spirochaetia bacterium]